MLPSQLLARGIRPDGPIAVDTETSGLYTDEGARIAAVSVAWLGELLVPSPEDNDPWVATSGPETIYGDYQENVVSFAWAFDQGVEGTGKAEDTGQLSLVSQNSNLPYEEWVALGTWLSWVGQENGLVFHHAKFDVHMFAAGLRGHEDSGLDLLDKTLWDTQNVCHLLWPEAKTTSLKPTAKRLWGIGETNESEMVQSYLRKAKLPSGRWDLVPWELIGPYADQDARLTIRLYYHQLEAIKQGAGDWFDDSELTLEQAIDRRLQTSKMLCRIERRGLPFDGPQALEMAEILSERQEKWEAQLPFLPPTLPMAKHYWFGSGIKNGIAGLGLVPYGLTASGQPQLNGQIINEMVKDNVPAADVWRNLQKLYTTDSRWYSGWASMAGPDGRLRASIRQNGTVSSRFSVERVQLQAIPHDYRLNGYEALEGIKTPRQLIAAGVPEGYQLWELDLAQAELRVAALFAGCQRMLDLIENDQDLHGDAATQLFNVTPADEDWGQMRNVAKRANFSLIFGVGAEKLQGDIEAQTGLVLSLDETRRLVRDWNGLYPEFQQAIRFHMNKVEERMKSHPHGLGWVTVKNGERRWFQSGEETHKAFNQRVQPSLAQFGIDWWTAVENDLRHKLTDPKAGMVMVIHDSMVLLLPDDERGETMSQSAADVAIDLWGRWFDGVPGGVDRKRWG
jgi:DNA polymerase I-like protein with 3'-5' exonuclease and polymerase domains